MLAVSKPVMRLLAGFYAQLFFLLFLFTNEVFSMNIALLQYGPQWEAPEKNKEKIRQMLASHAGGFDLLVLPEMTLTGFTMQGTHYAEKPGGPSFAFFSALAKEYGAHLFSGIIEERNGKVYNANVHHDRSGQMKALYRKIHPFTYAGEDKHYAPGAEPVTAHIDGIPAGLSVCYDLRFPELYRRYARERAQLLVVMANWPVQRIQHWRALLRARAIENQAYVIGVNRTGSDPIARYNGFSGVYSPMGEALLEVEEAEGVFGVAIDPLLTEKTRKKMPFLEDIRLV